VDLTKISTGEKVIGIAGIVLFIDSFLGWLGAKADLGPLGSSSEAGSAWDFTLPTVAVLIGILLVVVVVLRVFGVGVPEQLGPIGLGFAYLVLGAFAFLLVLIKLIVGPDLPELASQFGVEATREIGIFIGLICTAGLAAGGYLVAKEKGQLQLPKGGGSTPPAA